MNQIIPLSIVAAGAVLGGVNPASAAVLIDWSTAAVTTTDVNGTWNSIGASGSANVATTSLVDTTGAASGWSVAVTLGQTGAGAPVGFGGTGIDGPTGPAPFAGTGTTRPTIDGIYSQNNLAASIATITFSGLTANTVYSFSAIGGRATNAQDGIIDTAPGVTGGEFSLLNNGTVLNWTQTADGTGNLSFTFNGTATSGTGSSATFNALQVSQIPEPSSALLGGLGLLTLLRRRRK